MIPKLSSWRVVAIVSAVAALSPAACGESVFDVTDFGTIRYDLSASGAPPPESASFHIDYRHLDIEDARSGEPFTPRFLPRTMDNVPAGRVVVTLTQMPDDCSVADDSRVVQVPVDGIVDVTYEVNCG